MYKSPGTVAHEFLVFAIYYKKPKSEDSDPPTRLTYVRIDRFFKVDKSNQAGPKKTGSSAAAPTTPAAADVAAPQPHPLSQATNGEPDTSSPSPSLHPDAPSQSNTPAQKKSSFSVSSASSSEASFSISPYAESDDRFYMNESLSEMIYSNKKVEKYETAVTFAGHMDPMELLVLASTIKDVAPGYKVYSHNCYFFAKIVLDLAVELFRGKAVQLKDGKHGRAAHLIPLPFLANDKKYLDLVDNAKKRYPAKWAEFEREVSPILRVT